MNWALGLGITAFTEVGHNIEYRLNASFFAWNTFKKIKKMILLIIFNNLHLQLITLLNLKKFEHENILAIHLLLPYYCWF